MDDSIHSELGLTDDEFEAIRHVLGRQPNHLELAMYAVMWSEHCSYKSSRVHLGRLPSEGPAVLVGPGENAGVVDAGDGIAVALRMESHNHPSAIEPYQGAATGVGGIVRDILAMGARPIALMDSLRFGPPTDPRSRWIATGVVSGISGYGNSVGVPTVGGEIAFDPCYRDNPLVNVLCCGLVRIDRMVRSQAPGPGNLAVLLGATTGRDGIGGVSVLASAGFAADAASEAKRPNVQVGDPFEEKRLIEACLELTDQGLVVGVQDLGGAGLTSAASETASRAGTGMDVNVKAVALREPGMEPWEVMTSESQERMLAIVAPDDLPRVEEVCKRWEVRACVVGKVTAGGRLRVLDGWEGAVLADIPASSLHDDAPRYHRPMKAPDGLDVRHADDPATLEAPEDCGADLLTLLADPAWVYRQYDHQLFLNTIAGPGAEAALLRLAAPGVTDTPAHPPWKALALSTDGNQHWCSLDPRAGTALLLAESALNVACVGARSVAAVNCLNFGNPEDPAVMWQFSEAIDGLAEASRQLGLPVVGGNVSLYNESAGRSIEPTPVVAVLGLRDRVERRPPAPTLQAGGRLVLLGPPVVSLGGSRWAVELRTHRGGTLAALDYGLHSRLLALVQQLVLSDLVGGIHDVSDGGLGVALAEMAVQGGCGFVVSGIRDHRELFGEGPSRVLLCVEEQHLEPVLAGAAAAGIAATQVGTAGGDRLVLEGLFDLSLEEATSAWSGALPKALAPSAASGEAAAQ
jgi:phosphoribosylformylglycinamidine synthase II